jgi:ribosomal protein S11
MDRYILHIRNTPNNLSYNLTDYKGNTIFLLTAKAAKYKSKQVRSTLVIKNLWKLFINKLKTYKILPISIVFWGMEFKKKKFLQLLTENKIPLLSITIKLPVAHNGTKTKHYRRV